MTLEKILGYFGTYTAGVDGAVSSFQFEYLTSLGFAAIVIFLGHAIVKRSALLKKFAIPAPVVSGLLFSIAVAILKASGVMAFSFDVKTIHDLCKANFYKKGTRNVKNEATGQWEKVPSYSVEDMFPYGHGEKSVFLIERFMKLKVEEAVAIRWHMGGFDDAVRGGSFALSGAFEKYPLAVKLHIADLEATYLLEQRGE